MDINFEISHYIMCIQQCSHPFC